MTNIVIAIFLLGSTYGLYLGVQAYVSRSMRSFGNAEFVWDELVTEARTIVESDVPTNVAKLVVALTATAGCGCYVRGLLIAHYLPKFFILRGERNGKWSGSLEEVENLPSELRDRFQRMMSLIILYDGYRNPTHGWLFRRVMKSYTEGRQSFQQKLETKLTAVSVLSRKEPLERLEMVEKTLIAA